MFPVAIAALVGSLIGFLRRPLGAHLADPVIVLPGVAIVAIGAQIGLGLLDTSADGPLLGLSLAALAGFCVVNRHLIGMGVVSIGVACNAIVVLANGAMPVRPTAVVAAGVVEPSGLIGLDLGAGRRFEQTGDLVPWLGDVIPVSVFGAAMSFGDLIVLMGIGALSADLLRFARRRVHGRRRATATPVPDRHDSMDTVIDPMDTVIDPMGPVIDPMGPVIDPMGPVIDLVSLRPGQAADVPGPLRTSA